MTYQAKPTSPLFSMTGGHPRISGSISFLAPRLLFHPRVLLTAFPVVHNRPDAHMYDYSEILLFSGVSMCTGASYTRSTSDQTRCLDTVR